MYKDENKTTPEKDHLYITRKQGTLFGAGILVICLFIFVIGYFLGKKSVMDEFSKKISKDSFVDQVEYAFATQALRQADNDQDEDEENEDVVAFDTENETPSQSAPAQNIMMDNKPEEKAISIVPSENSNSISTQTVPSESFCYAKLVGFGTQKAAISFAERLKQQKINVQIKTNISKTAQGKKRIWYQATTPEYSSIASLEQDINKIVKFEHIRKQDVQIIQIPSNQ